MRKHPATAAYAAWLTGLGGEVRTVAALPLRMVIFDRRTVITPLDPENSGAGGIQLSEPGVVAGLSALFDRFWGSALPLGTEPERDEEGLTGQEHELLRLVGAGLTDEAAVLRKVYDGASVRGDSSALERYLSAHGLRHYVEYDPASEFAAMQAIDAAVFAGPAVLLLAGAVGLVRRRTA